jgi:hypothetical protein
VCSDHVPLITLTRINTPRIKEVKITANLEVAADESDEIYIAFPNQVKKRLFSNNNHKNTTNTRIDITLTGE